MGCFVGKGVGCGILASLDELEEVAADEVEDPLWDLPLLVVRAPLEQSPDLPLLPDADPDDPLVSLVDLPEV